MQQTQSSKCCERKAVHTLHHSSESVGRRLTPLNRENEIDVDGRLQLGVTLGL
jgi:hypothetical protein